MNIELLKSLIQQNEKKMLLIILDGVGGIPDSSKMTELEKANKKNMDELAKNNDLGYMVPVDIGITPGSGPGHLAVFGYEPTEYPIGRGILEALGLDIKIDEKTVTARCNFATINTEGKIIDRRAGRISSEENIRLVKKLNENFKDFGKYKVEFYSGKEHRFVLVVRGIENDAYINDTDPQVVMEKPLKAKSIKGNSEECANIINEIFEKSLKILKDEQKANSILFRGISKMPAIEPFKDRYGLNPACIATYPMYKGLASLVKMDILKTGETLKDQIEALKENYNKYDFFFFHVKKTDSYGEDGDFENKTKVIEEFDKLLPEILSLDFEVVAITSDHSTPSVMKAHSYHYVPLLFINKYPRPVEVKGFSERECLKGSIGKIYSKELIALMLAASSKLKKFGA
ncbi:MAG: 2,3-bisphosphoglycerate-independent phosphoglycerate mutase [candidate division WOR-3 bacterium]